MRHLFLSLLSIISLFASAQTPFIDFITPTIVRVRWNPEGVKTDNATGVCRTSHSPVDVKTVRCDGNTCIQSDSLRVMISDTGAIAFYEKSGEKLVRVLKTADQAIAVRAFACDTGVRERLVYDDASARMEETANGKVTVKDVISRDTIGISRRFRMSFINEGEALYGLGSQMEDYMNLMGKNLYLTQHNLKIMVPMLVSTKGYGLLFDAGCSMKFESDPLLRSAKVPYAQMTTIEFEAANTADYYFIMGPTMEQVVEGYRYLTGNVSMMPRYLFGYTQSKERFVSSEVIVNTVKE